MSNDGQWQPTEEQRRRMSAVNPDPALRPQRQPATPTQAKKPEPKYRLAVSDNPRMRGTPARARFDEMMTVMAEAGGPLTATELLSRCQTYTRDDLRHDRSCGRLVEVKTEGEE